MFLQVHSAPYDGRQDQSAKQAPRTKDKEEHRGRNCDAHRVDADFPTQIDEEDDERDRAIAERDHGDEPRCPDEQQHGCADEERNRRDEQPAPSFLTCGNVYIVRACPAYQHSKDAEGQDCRKKRREKR